MTTRFVARKQKILEQLDTPDTEYHDLSPKGSVDEPIRALIGEINALDGLVTTSSCSGRISVFLEGRKTGLNDVTEEEGEESRAGPGGKGGGGAWLFISHTPIERLQNESTATFAAQFGLTGLDIGDESPISVNSRYIHLKFEPMILHILSASTDHAQRVLTAALSAGFRESGSVSLGVAKNGESTPMVAVRSTGYSFDSIIGYQNGHGQNIALVDEKYLRILVDIANDRFRINSERIARFRDKLMEIYHPTSASLDDASNAEWEDPEVRKRRKREEGLARQQALKALKSNQNAQNDDTEDFDNVEIIQGQ